MSRRDPLVAALIVTGAFAWVWAPVLTGNRSPRTEPGPSAAEYHALDWEHSLSAWVLEGSGEPSCNGCYRVRGTYNNMPMYAGPGEDGEYFIYFTGPNWAVSSAPGDPSRELYYSSDEALPGNPWSRGNGPAPPPTTTQAPQWVIEGAGDCSYDGGYAAYGLHDGRPCYTNGSRYLFWNAGNCRWALGGTPGTSTPAYACGDTLLSTWLRDFGVAPAPALRAAPLTTNDAPATWRVAGAGDSSYDGEYMRAGSRNGRPWYVCEGEDGPRYLVWITNSRADCWALSDALCDEPTDGYVAASGEKTLPANPWGLNLAQAPAPTLSAAPDHDEPSPAVTPSEE